jgi:GT2 family glycosyltransferase
VNCIDFDYCADCFRNLKGEHNPSHAFEAIHALDNSVKLRANDLYRPAGRVIELGDAGGYAGGYPPASGGYIVNGGYPEFGGFPEEGGRYIMY